MELKELLALRTHAILTLKKMQQFDFDCENCEKHTLRGCPNCSYFSDFCPTKEWQEAHKDVTVSEKDNT